MSSASAYLFVLLFSVAHAATPRNSVNITVYHINQATFGAAPVNMDTGDAKGDLYFDLRSVDLPLECAHPSSSSAHDCQNAEVVSPNLVVTQLVLEVDQGFSQYGRCNVCVNGSDNHGTNCTKQGIPDGDYFCGCGSWGKPPIACGAPVGKEDILQHMGGYDCQPASPVWDCWKSNAAKKIGGTWYSTTRAGWCGGDSPSPNCTWRVVQAVKRISKSCSDDVIYTTVEKADKAGCFSKCGPKRNATSECWINCFYQTTLGVEASKPHATLGGMPTQDIVAAWEQAFNEPSQGGCQGLPIPPGAEEVASHSHAVLPLLDDATYFKLVDVAGVAGCVDTQVSADTANTFGGTLGECKSQGYAISTGDQKIPFCCTVHGWKKS